MVYNTEVTERWTVQPYWWFQQGFTGVYPTQYTNDPMHAKSLSIYVAWIEVDILYQLYYGGLAVDIWFQ